MIVPPFAEELNRCRRMMSEQARALAESGLRVFLPDLYGTGDSAGDFSEARWETWCESLSALVERTTRKSGGALGILAVRLGALLAFDSRTNIASGARSIVLWNPCASGSLFLKQFLRLRLASQLASGTGRRETVAELMERLKSGQSLEIAGYEVLPDMALAIEAATLEAAELPDSIPVTWFEVGSMTDTLSAGASKLVRQWQEKGIDVRAESIPGNQFWGTVEITLVPALIEKTTCAFKAA